ncbi:MAG: type II toxin-antitoxin system RelE/ParE family toxin [Deltaproteobacteria bacterium]|jgi:mRNA-degrading endonuclease RelE of RelBE toxin-antitoxin system|nr:type II toxin-antitoxin system RelE/ParE family toxin [Deltaproteobacteria bacterium]
MLYEFVELAPFAEVRDTMFTAQEFSDLQIFLCGQPESGNVIPGTSGCRKLRWQSKGRGKQGGARIIYFLRLASGQIILITAYGKNVRDDIPREWLRTIKEAYDHEIS